MKVSVIVVNYNQKYFPRMCVDHLEKTRSEAERFFQVIVVDNGSTDESIHYLREMDKEGRIKLIESGKNLGYGKGNNLGVANADGEYILIANPDIFVEPDTLQKLVTYADSHKEAGIIGPKLIYYNGVIQDSCRRHMSPFDLVIKRTFLRKLPFFKKRVEKYLMEDFDHSKTQEVDLITGACFLIPKKLYDKVGGFDERYFLFMEDFDLCRKVAREGKKIVYYPEAHAEHYHKRLSSGNIFWLLKQKVFWIHLSSAIKYFWKWRKG